MALVLATTALLGFAARQTVLSRNPKTGRALMDVRLFSIGSFRNGNIATLIIGVGEFGIVAVLPLCLQFTLDYSAVQAGLALVPIAIGSFVASGASFGLASTASPLDLVRLGLLLEAFGLAGLAFIATVDAPWWHLAGMLFCYGVRVGFATAQVTNVVLGDIPEQSSGQASGIQSAFRQLGSALGIAVLTTTFFSTLSSTLNTKLTGSGTPQKQADSFTHAVTDSADAAIKGLAAQPQTQLVASVARDAMTHSIILDGYIAASVIALGLIATAFIRNQAAPPAADQGPAVEPVAGGHRQQ